MSRVVRIGVTETCSAYRHMPASLDALASVAGHLDALREANLEHHRELIAAAAGAGVRALGLGELFGAPYFALTREPAWRALAEDALNGPTTTAMRLAAREHGIVLVCPLYELCPRSGKRFNAAVVIDADGTLLGRYRKTHIPHGANEQGAFEETYYYERSDGELGDWPRNVAKNRFFPVFDTAIGKVGVAICYDRHFPRVMETLAGEGAELVFCPAVTFGASSRALWELEFLVDAARHRIFIAGSNRRGREAPWNQAYFGASYVAGPNGRLPAVADAPVGLVLADVDLALVHAPNPAGWTLREDERPSIYGAGATPPPLTP